METILSILIGVLPEIIYYYYMIKNIIEIKNKKILLFVIIFISYMISTFIMNYNIYAYILFYIFIYISLSLFKKRLITDFLVIMFLELYLLIISCICYFGIPNYTIAFIINRTLLFIPFILKNKLKNLYKKYKSMWNRNYKVKQPIKSITLRNISLIIVNILAITLYFTLLFITNKLQ